MSSVVSRHERCSVILSTMDRPDPNEKIKSLPEEIVVKVQESEDATSLNQVLAKYAFQHAGTDADLDRDLEAAAIDHLIA